MKKSLILFLLVLTGSNLLAQGEKEQRFSVGLTLLPTYNSILYDDSQSPDNGLADAFETLEIPFVGLNGGIDALYQLNNRLEIYSGIHFWRAGWNTREYELYSIVYDPSLPQKISWQFRFDYLRVPVEMRIFIIKGFYAQAGAGINFLYDVWERRVETYRDGHVEINRIDYVNGYYNKVVVSGNLQLGYTFNRNNRWNYSLAAYSSYGVNRIYDNDHLNRRFFGLGSAMQVCYSI